MIYKLSNNAEQKEMEFEFDAKIRYPNIYSQENTINGLRESSIPVITMRKPDVIDCSIWGILPEDWEDDWEKFQEYKYTLHLSAKRKPKYPWYAEAFIKRRCLLLVTGFYTSHLKNGIVEQSLIKVESNKPFCLAGIYNQLDDGFLTCAFITSTSSKEFKKIHNIGDEMPLIVPKEKRADWLEEDLSETDLEILISTLDNSEMVKGSPKPNLLVDKKHTGLSKELEEYIIAVSQKK